MWDKQKIASVLPQREPFLFIDEILDIVGTEKVVAYRNLREDENYFKGHFPEKPIMPGVLIIEALAQASLILYSIVKPDVVAANPDYYLGKVKAEFLAPAYPGDKLILEANKVKFLDYAAITDTEARIKDKIVAKANIVFSIQKNE